MAKLEYRPRVEFMELLVEECEARGLEGFEAQHLANVLNGEDWADRPTTSQAKADVDAYGVLPHHVTGFAKLGYYPGDSFMDLFVDVCVEMQLRDFVPQALANVINGEHRQLLASPGCNTQTVVLLMGQQGSPSLRAGTGLTRSSWSCS
jgi:hypothetical protein